MQPLELYSTNAIIHHCRHPNLNHTPCAGNHHTTSLLFTHTAHGSESVEEEQRAKFHCTARDHNDASRCIPATLCKRGIGEINSAEDSGPVSLTSDALNGFGPIIVCVCVCACS